MGSMNLWYLPRVRQAGQGKLSTRFCASSLLQHSSHIIICLQVSLTMHDSASMHTLHYLALQLSPPPVVLALLAFSLQFFLNSYAQFLTPCGGGHRRLEQRLAFLVRTPHLHRLNLIVDLQLPHYYSRAQPNSQFSMEKGYWHLLQLMVTNVCSHPRLHLRQGVFWHSQMEQKFQPQPMGHKSNQNCDLQEWHACIEPNAKFLAKMDLPQQGHGTKFRACRQCLHFIFSPIIGFSKWYSGRQHSGQVVQMTFLSHSLQWYSFMPSYMTISGGWQISPPHAQINSLNFCKHSVHSVVSPMTYWLADLYMRVLQAGAGQRKQQHQKLHFLQAMSSPVLGLEMSLVQFSTLQSGHLRWVQKTLPQFQQQMQVTNTKPVTQLFSGGRLQREQITSVNLVSIGETKYYRSCNFGAMDKNYYQDWKQRLNAQPNILKSLLILACTY